MTGTQLMPPVVWRKKSIEAAPDLLADRVMMEARVKRILVATDLSARSHRAFRRAGWLAEAAGSELVLVHVVDDRQAQRMIELDVAESRKVLDTWIASRVVPKTVFCRSVISTGRPHIGIIQAAKDIDADLIVMGSHRKRFRDLFVGTTIERVIRQAGIPVLMVNTDEPYDTVMIAADLSAASAEAVTSAARLGFLSKGRIAIVHAFYAVAKSKLALAQAPKEKISMYVKEEQQKALVKLKDFMRSVPGAPTRWMPYVEEGEASCVIGAAVEQMSPELLILGTQGRTGAVKLLLGSVTEELLESATIDVLTVPIWRDPGQIASRERQRGPNISGDERRACIQLGEARNATRGDRIRNPVSIYTTWRDTSLRMPKEVCE